MNRLWSKPLKAGGHVRDVEHWAKGGEGALNLPCGDGCLQRRDEFRFLYPVEDD